MLSEFDIKYVTQKSVRGGGITDQLAESPIDGEDGILNEFPDGGVYGIDELEEDVWEMYFDGSVNMYRSGVGVNGEWQTKDRNLIPYQKYLSSLAEKFEEIFFSHVTRDKNQFADALATLAVRTKLEVHASVLPIQVTDQDEPSYCFAKLEADGEPWYHDVKRYIQHKEYPEGVSDVNKKTIHHLAGTFFVNGKVLYKRSHDGTLLICVDTREIQLIMT
ncbi:PREDICTED: uncharacterized protein LOC109329288 [Lupinus angustifolius]|uniref:uncharacterized protein LOC109329288 n=1 Tax=Lupinus angustifolius TaxID=3871 RepID=UPI00092FD696|nr:PREDICTED: uncharacterized protein LOC109329288 [Lupinus angustifolius]